MEIRDFVITVVIIATMVTGAVAFMTDLNTNYQVSVPSLYADAFGNINNSITQSNNLANKLQSITEEKEGLGTGDLLTLFAQASIQAIRVAFDSLSTAMSMLAIGAGILGIPAWFFGALVSIMGIWLSYKIWSAIFRKET